MEWSTSINVWYELVMEARPPKLAEKILSKLQYDDVWKTTLGDFEEYYQYKLEREGIKAANRWYWQQVIKYAPSKVIHKIYWGAAMFKNYLKIAFRNIKNQKSYSFINIVGLGVGLSAFIMIALFVNYEFSYDSFHENSDRTYRVIAQQPDNEYLGSNWFAVTPTAMAATLKEDYPEIEKAAYFSRSRSVLRTETAAFQEWGATADGDFFDVFSFQMNAGNPLTALNDPYSIIITQTMANKLFGDDNPINKTIEQVYPNGETTQKTVTGVVVDPPKNSHFSFSYIANDQTTPYYKYNLKEWRNTNVYTFITLKEGFEKEEFESKLPGFTEKYIAASNNNQSNPNSVPNHALQAIQDIHLKSGFLNMNPGKLGDIKFVYMFGIVAVITLLIACINYMNLSTARSLTRHKEIGVRKVIGAYKSNLMMQFLSEAVVISLLSTFSALILTALLLPFFGEIMNRDLNYRIFLNLKFWFFTIGTSLLVGIISGSYPAFYLSKLKPVSVFKSNINSKKSSSFFRNLLVIGQFTVTAILLIGTMVVFQQLNYLKTTDTGLDREQIISIPNNDPELWDRFETVKTELLKTSGIEMISASQSDPIYMSSQTIWNGQEEGEELPIYVSPVHYDFQEMFGLEIIAGQNFSEERFKETDASYMINEVAAKELGWTPEEAIGKPFSVWGNDGTIVGVGKDFNFLSLDQPIAPLVLMLAPQYDSRYLLVKANGADTPRILSDIEQILNSFSPGFPFSYTFLDESYSQMYQDEVRMGTMFNFFSVLALLIACMGLFGLATFIAERRTKEIGIRKVLGANLFQILSLLNKDFIILVAISFLIAVPVAWYLSSNWLQEFAFRIDLSPKIFVFAAALLFGIAVLTVSFKSIKTAFSNPVESLKSE